MFGLSDDIGRYAREAELTRLRLDKGDAMDAFCREFGWSKTQAEAILRLIHADFDLRFAEAMA